MTHYFTNDFESEKKLTISGKIAGTELSLMTGPGIFSYKEFDEGTKIMLEAFSQGTGYLEKDPFPQDCGTQDDVRVLDLCAGYGLVASYIKKTYPDMDVDAVEINERACDFAAHNIINNGGAKEDVICKDTGEWLPQQKGAYDVILVNPPFSVGKQFCFGLIESSKIALKEGGELWLVAPTKKGAKSYKKKLEEVFDSVEQVAMDKGYRVYLAK